jgi:predicted PurR-regulated permease PerM
MAVVSAAAAIRTARGKDEAMSPILQAAMSIGAWILVVLLLAGGYWFLRRHQLLHTATVVILSLVGLFLLIHLKELVIMLVLAGVLAFILDGLVERLTRVIPRPLAIAAVYIGLVLVLGLIGAFVIPRVVRQARQLVYHLPQYADQAKQLAGRLTTLYGGAPGNVQNAIESGIQQLQGASKSATRQVERALLGILGWTVKGLLSVVMSVYLLTDKENLGRQFLQVFPSEARAEVQATVAELSLTFSRYLRGQMTVILFVATSVTVALVGFGIPYAFFIGFVAGVLEVIPYFGALAGAVPAVTLGFMVRSVPTGIGLIVFFIAINQIEGHVVIPLVMGRHLEMRPLTILLALIAGEQLGGIVGMIVAVPALSLLRVLIPHLVRHYQRFRAGEHGIWTPHPSTEAHAARVQESAET